MDPSIYHRFFEVEDHHWWFVGRRAIVGRLMEQELVTSSGSAATHRILDIGCGTGGMLPLLSRFGRVTGIDSEPLALDYCRRRGFTDVALQEGFAASAPFEVVTLFDVLEHVPDEAGFLNWIQGLLAPGGHLIVTVPAFPSLWSRHDELNHHCRRYRSASLRAALTRAGFHIARMTYFNFLLFPLAAADRLVGGRKGRAAGLDPARDAADILKPLEIGPLNAPLSAIFSSEASLVGKTDLPYGVSLFAAARRG
jgi:SAM-dependent methyltransferase